MGGKVAEVAAALGTPLMPWQRQVADAALEVDDDGLLVYREVRLTVPRQSGKTTLLLALMVHRAWGFGGPQRIVYTAQTAQAARKKWDQDHVPALERSLFGSQFLARHTNGDESIRWKNGSIHSVVAPTRTAVHGETLDLGVIDEAFAQPDNRTEQAMKPAMITRPSPQMWIVSTAGDTEGSYFWEKCQSGRALAEQGETSGVAYFEWSAPLEVDPLDEAVWWSCMPALGNTIKAKDVASDAKSMPVDEFRRAYLNHWISVEGVVNALPGWGECVDRASVLVDPVVLALDVAPNLSSASIAAAGLNADGRFHVEVIHTDLGTGWVVEKLRAIVDRQKPAGLLVGASGPAAALIPDLKNAGLLPADYKGEQTNVLAKASQFLLDKVSNRDVAHIGQSPLMAAVAGAVRKSYGDGGFLWNRHGSSVDISPLVAATLALWGFVNRPEPADATPLFAFSK